ncbi:MAG: nucleoside triphosphate pyrophosphohydrolase [Deltaproteobacteria bacterium]|nr:nucleoside triphosphate pyrophosphohydrolase [Deltaproteobacteria bacterium]
MESKTPKPKAAAGPLGPAAERPSRETKTPKAGAKVSAKTSPAGTKTSAKLPPAGPSRDAQAALGRLEVMIDGLLDPVVGCPWDRKQTTKTITEDLLEEVYELREALNEDKAADILEEAGDLAFLLAFLGRLTTKAFGFGLKDIFDAATDKMVTRHPHVFGDDQPIKDMETFWKKWHQMKRQAKPKSGVLDSVPTGLPALTRCHRLAQKAGRSGFDFPAAENVRQAIDSELRELDREIKGGKTEDPAERERQAHELGDVLASVANLARLLGFSAEKCLDAHNRRFVNRFRHMEESLRQEGLRPEEAGMEKLDQLWERAKRALADKESPSKGAGAKSQIPKAPEVQKVPGGPGAPGPPKVSKATRVTKVSGVPGSPKASKATRATKVPGTPGSPKAPKATRVPKVPRASKGREG